MEYIKSKLSDDLAKKIIGNQDNAIKYLLCLNDIKPIKSLKFKTITRGQNAGKKVLNMKTSELWKAIVDSWDYEESKKIIRDIFKQTEKYKSGKEADKAMDILIKEWQSLKLGNIAWPFSQGAFDEFVQRINSEKENGFIRDEKVKVAAVKYRRIKEINTVRNDFIETLIFEKNNNILPTLNHRRGVDFFINGISFDQKVAKSPTNEFKRDFGENWKEQVSQRLTNRWFICCKGRGFELMKTNTLLFIIDMQNDFCRPDGALFVPGADRDTARLGKFFIHSYFPT